MEGLVVVLTEGLLVGVSDMVDEDDFVGVCVFVAVAV